eukprot:scaffold10136_cov126-Isochrysis_galbana.AAC.5
MAPLQLRLEPTEVVLATDKGAARARPGASAQRTADVSACTYGVGVSITLVGKSKSGGYIGTDTILVEKASDLVYAGEQTSYMYMCAEQVRTCLQGMRGGMQALDIIIVNTPEAIQVTLARKCPPAQMREVLQEEIPTFLQKLQEVEPCEVLGVGVARVRASGSRMLAWITYGGPD